MANTLPVQVGDQAPNFCLKDTDEREQCLHSFWGKWVVLYFYPKDNTSGCTIEAQEFTALLPSFREQGAEVIGVSPDSCQSHQKFREQHQLQVLLLSDPEHEVLEKFGVWQKKKLYGREFWGVVRTTFLISPDGKVAYVWPNVKAKGHAQQVLQKLQELKG